MKILVSKEVGFSAVAVWTKGGGGFGRKWGWFGMKKRGRFWISVRTILGIVSNVKKKKKVGLGMNLVS